MAWVAGEEETIRENEEKRFIVLEACFQNSRISEMVRLWKERLFQRTS